MSRILETMDYTPFSAVPTYTGLKSEDFSKIMSVLLWKTEDPSQTCPSPDIEPCPMEWITNTKSMNVFPRIEKAYKKFRITKSRKQWRK